MTVTTRGGLALTAAEAKRVAEFRAVFRGRSAWRVALALNQLARGIDWRGSTLADMAESLALGQPYPTGITPAAVAAVLAKEEKR